MFFDLAFAIFSIFVTYLCYKYIFTNKETPQINNGNLQQQIDQNEDQDIQQKSRKEIIKEQIKQQKKQQKQEELQYRKKLIEENEKKITEKSQKQIDFELEKELKEKKKQEELLKQKELQEKQEQEEYNKWNKLMEIEEQGQMTKIEDPELIQKFIDFIKTRKMVLLEDISSEFHLTTQQVMDRIQNLEVLEELNGVLDERGKYIYLTQQEMQKIKDYIQSRGRVSRQELTLECNRLIRLNPTGEDLEKIKKEEEFLTKQAEYELQEIQQK